MTHGDGTAQGGNTTTRAKHKNASPTIDHDELSDLTDLVTRVRDPLQDAIQDVLDPNLDHHAEPLTDALLKANADATTLNEACHDTPLPVTRRTLENVLTTMDPGPVETRLNDVLWTQAEPLLPTRVYVAVDFKEIAYWGNPDKHTDQEELTRGRARNGTTHFHRYATAYLCRGNKRYTLAVHFVRGDETPSEAVQALLQPLLDRGLPMDLVLLDRGFSDSKVASWLHDRGLPFVMPWIKRGQLADRMEKARASHWFTHTFGQETLEVNVAMAVKRGPDGLDRLPYVAMGFDPMETTPHKVHKLYKQRNGVETSYRQAEKARARTNSRDPARRLLFLCVGFVLLNAHVRVGWERAPPKRGRTGRERDPNASVFERFLRRIVRRLDLHYGVMVVWVPLPSRGGGG